MTPNPTKTCTVKNAVTGECGKPAIYVEESRIFPGTFHGECVEHAHQHGSLFTTQHMVARQPVEPKRQTKFNVRGHVVRSTSNRQFIVVYITPSSAKVVKRSDSAAVAIKAAEKYGYRIRNVGNPTYAVVIDTTDGSEV